MDGLPYPRTLAKKLKQNSGHVMSDLLLKDVCPAKPRKIVLDYHEVMVATRRQGALSRHVYEHAF